MVSERYCRLLAASLVLAGFVGSMNGCKPDPAVKQGAIVDRGTNDQGAPPPGEPQTATAEVPTVPQPAIQTEAPGGISGTIFFHGKPPVATIDTSMDPACSLGGGKPRLPVEQFVVKGGKLANVFLYVKNGPAEAMQGGAVPPQPVVLDQKNCQYLPHVIGVTVGGTVEFRNSDPTMHNIHTMPVNVSDPTIDISQSPRGQPVRRQFQHPELMIPVRCNNHPWMNAFINVSPTPYFAVTDADGHFDLKGLPPGNYVLGAVHEKMGEKTMQVTVTSRSIAKAEFSFAQ